MGENRWVRDCFGLLETIYRNKRWRHGENGRVISPPPLQQLELLETGTGFICSSGHLQLGNSFPTVLRYSENDGQRGIQTPASPSHLHERIKLQPPDQTFCMSAEREKMSALHSDIDVTHGALNLCGLVQE